MFSPERLELARKRRRMTATIVAEKVGITTVSLSRITHGVHAAEDDTINAFAKALAYPREFFLHAI